MKKTQVKGNLVKSPTWNKTMTVCTARLAVDKAVQFKNEFGKFDYKTGYFDIKFFNKNLDIVKKMNLNAGDEIEVIGQDVIVEYPSSQSPNLIKTSFEILADEVSLISKKGSLDMLKKSKLDTEPTSKEKIKQSKIDFDSWL